MKEYPQTDHVKELVAHPPNEPAAGSEAAGSTQRSRAFCDSEPGEQRCRNYRWHGMGDPSSAVFGSKPMPKELLSGTQVKNLVQPQTESTPDTATILAPLAVEEHETRTHAQIGRRIQTKCVFIFILVTIIIVYLLCLCGYISLSFHLISLMY